jgi:hypothetical protein
MANTVIQLKWSEITQTPLALNVAEPAYSNATNKLFIGLAGNEVVAIGGKYYTDKVDEASALDSQTTLVVRDSLGSFNANVVYANSIVSNIIGSADSLTTARWFNINGDVDTSNTSFDGTANVDITLELTNTGVTAGDYGGSANIPVFNVDEDGRIVSAANVSITTSLGIAANTGTDSIALATDTLTFEGLDGVVTEIDAATNKVKFNVDSTVIRTSGGQTIGGDLAITGNLVISGETITQDVSTIRTEDALIEMAANNAADAVDIGFFGQYNDGVDKYTAFYRDASDSGNYKLLVGGTEKPLAANTVNATAFAVGTLVANITGGTVSGLTSDISVSDGGTGTSSFTAGQMLVGDGTNALQSLANTGTAGTYANASHVPVITTDDYGRVSGVTPTAISIDAAAISSGTLPIGRGGTNQTTFNADQLIIFNGTSLSSRANVSQTITGALAAGNTITSIAFDPISGGVTSFTGSEINIDASQITTGTLSVNRGGTGADLFTTKGVIVSDSASTTGALTALTSAEEGHVLQINSSGVPTFAYLQGGTF